MLYFFRRIRKSLLGSGQAKKYLLYAIGEILLVMIGILLALQVNNWNEQRKYNLAFEQLLSAFERDLFEHIENANAYLRYEYYKDTSIQMVLSDTLPGKVIRGRRIELLGGQNLWSRPRTTPKKTF